jgi:uncharacterized protein (TIGR02996 family)
MNHREAFVQSIREAPDDDVPRLIYADWLEDNGEPERAEFIRFQCALARGGLAEAERAALARRERALLETHKGPWR